MQTAIEWIDHIPERKGVISAVNVIAFKPDGSQLIAAVGERILIYDPNDGKLIQSLKAHKDIVYSLDYSRNGKRFASGGADKTVIIWTAKGEGVLKYSHSDSIQCLAFNPTTSALVSCTSADYGIWSPSQKSVAKTKVVSKILCASWNIQGTYLALGMFNGSISIRNKENSEVCCIEREAPIWCIQWNTSKTEPTDILAVGCWDQTLSFYQSSGKKHGKEKKLSFLPCTLQYYKDGKYLIIGGSNKKALLYTREGTFLSEISSETENAGWVWTARYRPESQQVTIGTNNGHILSYRLVMGAVHGIFEERYAYRENMTDIVIQHLMTEQKVRIKARDLVQKVAIYRDRLAVQLSDRIIIYEVANNNSLDMQYRVRERISSSFECTFLFVTSLHIVVGQEKKLTQYTFKGIKEREWIMESLIKYIKLLGGHPGKESLLVGLKNGQVTQIFLQNPFPIPLIKQPYSIRCVDISNDRKQLAVVNDHKTCTVYNMQTKEMIYQHEEANSVAWNSQSNQMLAFSGNDQLKIQTESLPFHSQRMQGHVVGFVGSKVFCLHNSTIKTMDIPQFDPFYRYLEDNELEKAYSIACLGVTESDWRLLAMTAMKAMNFHISRKSFIRINDFKYMDLLNTLEKQYKTDKNDNVELYTAEILANEKQFLKAAKIYAKYGQPEKAIALFTELRMWEDAKEFASEYGTVNVSELAQRQASWAAEVHDWRAAAEMYAASGDYSKAIKIIGERKWFDELMVLSKKLDPRRQKEEFKLCARYFYDEKKFSQCKEIYSKIEDVEALMKLHIELKEWSEAVVLSKKYVGKFSKDIFIPYAEWLACHDQFEECLDAYDNAGRPDQSIKLLIDLAKNAATEYRYEDASYFHFRLSKQYFSLDEVSNGKKHDQLANLYFAFKYIYSYTDDPFTQVNAETLFHSAQFITNVLGKNEAPLGISKAKTLYALAMQSMHLGAFKLARYAFDKLHRLAIPTKWNNQMDFCMMTLQTKPFKDKEDLIPIDYQTSCSNPLVNMSGTGDCSANNNVPFIRSFLSFDILPLVEFQPSRDISHEEAIRFIDQSNSSYSTKSDKKKQRDYDGWKETDHGNGIQSLKLDDNDDLEMMTQDDNNDHDSEGDANDLFSRICAKQTSISDNNVSFSPIILDEFALKSLKSTEIFVQKYAGTKPTFRYFKNVIPEIAIYLCSNCNRFSNQDEYDFELLKNQNKCPFCRTNGTVVDTQEIRSSEKKEILRQPENAEP